ncbi:transposase InsO family protein [Bradyrhizobium ottawaense]
MVTPAAKRKPVAHLVAAHGMSERRACKAIGCCRMTMRYQTTRADEAGLRQRMRAIAQERRRFGYRRLHVLLKREGYVVNHKKLFRLYREERLAVRRRGGRKRAIGTRAPMTVAMAPNDRWSLDFMSDQLTDGFRILTVVDDCTRECLALVADTSLSGSRVARELDRLIIERGKPKMVVSDNGTELTSNAILTWADQSRVAWHYIAPGKPTQNAFRKLQWPSPRRIAERDAVHVAGPGPSRTRTLAGRLQRYATSLATRMENTIGVRLHLQPATGSGAALCRWLRASSRRYHRPTKSIQQPERTQDWIKLGGKVTLLLAAGETDIEAALEHVVGDVKLTGGLADSFQKLGGG